MVMLSGFGASSVHSRGGGGGGGGVLRSPRALLVFTVPGCGALVGGSGDPNHPRLPRTASVALMCGCKTSSRCGSVRLFPWLEQRPPSHPKTAEQADRRAVFFSSSLLLWLMLTPQKSAVAPR